MGTIFRTWLQCYGGVYSAPTNTLVRRLPPCSVPKGDPDKAWIAQSVEHQTFNLRRIKAAPPRSTSPEQLELLLLGTLSGSFHELAIKKTTPADPVKLNITREEDANGNGSSTSTTSGRSSWGGIDQEDKALLAPSGDFLRQ
ncbi:unnamed protein product [Nezara viridula]|uniref:Uncharacterized protein n=1 Tax=Nezara viridula TaxID=85310 RepID=A0A9P0HFL0_NEZVI|nr:unnamed protein product [Nezara viridula]